MSIHAVSRVSVTSTVLCVIIWLLDIIILALSYSEFCKETQELVVTVEVKNSRAPRTRFLDDSEVSRECFYETTWKPYGHGMVCSFLAIFSSLFAISAHSEAGGACMSNQNSFRASLLCSLICLVSSSFGAFISAKLALITRNSPVQGVDPHVVDYIKVRILENEISILQSCLFIESGLQFLLAILCIYNVYKCSNILLGNDPHYAMLTGPNGVQSLELNTQLPPSMTAMPPMPQLGGYQRAMMTKSASNPEYGRQQNVYRPFHQLQYPHHPTRSYHDLKEHQPKTTTQATREQRVTTMYQQATIQQQKPAPFHPLTTSCSSSRDDDNSSLTNNDRRHSISSHFDTRNLEYKTQLQQEQQQQQGSTIKRPRSKSSDRLTSGGGQTKKCVSFKRQTSEYNFQ